MRYARWTARAAGHIIDVLVPAPFFAVAAFWASSDEQRVVCGILIALGFGVSAYNRLYLAGRTGQSWGRRAVGLQLVSARSGAPIGPVRALTREVLHLLDQFSLGIGYLMPLWTKRRQTIADSVARTVVIRSA